MITSTQLANFFKDRFEKLEETGHNFFIHGNKGEIVVSYGILHIDDILNAAKSDDDFTFIVPKSRYKLSQKFDDIDVSVFIPDVVDAFKHVNVNITATSSLVGNSKYIFGKSIISVNAFMDDMITTSLELKNIDKLLTNKSEEVVKIIDIFVNKCIEAKKYLISNAFSPTEQ